MGRRHRGLEIAADWLVVVLAGLIAVRPVAAEGLYARGDADCNSRFAAADVVASVQALGGVQGCGNGDCDRDGTLTAADTACAVTCLFGPCTIPPNAPHVATVVADSAPAIVPFSAIRITGTNFGSPGHLKRVTIGGLQAEVADFDGTDTLEVVVPGGVPPGPADVVVFDGEVAGPPMMITVAAAVPINPDDTLDTTLDLLDTAIGLLLALDLDSAFGVDAAVLRQSMQDARTALTAQRAALMTDPNVTPTIRAALDAALRSSGAAEMLRDLNAELEDLLVPSASQRIRPLANPAAIIGAFGRGAKTVRIVAAVATTATAPISLPVAAGIALVLGIATGVMIHFASSMPMAPVILGLSFADVNRNATERPVFSGYVKVVAKDPDPSTTALAIIEVRGAQTVTAVGTDGNALVFPLPGGDDFCGRVQFALFDTASKLGSISRVGSIVEPELVGLDPQIEGYIGARLDLLARGVSGCLDEAAALFGESRFAAPLARDLPTHVLIPDINPHGYAVRVSVAGVESKGSPNFNVLDLLAPAISCKTTMLAVPPSDEHVPPQSPVRTTCTAAPQPAGLPFPPSTEILWTSSDTLVGTVSTGTIHSTPPFGTFFDAFGPGTTMVMAAYSHKGTNKPAPETITMTVTDQSPPKLMVDGSPQPGTIDIGATITVTVTAHDNVAMRSLEVTATGDAIQGDAKQTFTCGLADPDCQTDFSFPLKSSGIMSQDVTLLVTATDRSDLKTGTSLTWTIKKDISCPDVIINSPDDGALIDGGSTVEVSAQATDNQQGDTGVKRFTYSATGDALVAPVAQTLNFPMALPAATLKFGFTVKNSEDLVSVNNKTIIVSVAAADDAKNTCDAHTISLTAVAKLEQCAGGISVDNPSDCIGKPFTITVILSGEGLDNVTRVTSINPGGQFDLDPQGNGVYKVTLFYEGEGSFTLFFYAFDADGKALCSNSIGLESTGDCPEASSRGVPARSPAGAVAGATTTTSPN